MDEIENPSLHQWLSACRLLMVHHPRQGALMAEIALGSTSFLRPGWNRLKLGDISRHKELFIFIGPEGGLTVPALPADVSPADVYTVSGQLTELTSTRLWAITKRLAEVLSQQNNGFYSNERISSVMDDIVRASHPNGITHDFETMSEWGRSCLVRMKRGLADRDSKLFIAPAIEIVVAYLSFELPGMIAREILGMVLSVQCNIPNLGPPSSTAPADRMRACEHLVTQAYRLLKGREDKNVSSFYEMSYLAGLYAGAALVLAANAAEAGGVLDTEQRRIQKLALNAEELSAHQIPPAFILPALFSPPQIVLQIVERAASSGRGIEDTASFYVLHPGLRSLLDPLIEQAKTKQQQAIMASIFRSFAQFGQDSNRLTRLYREYSDSCKSFDVWDAIETEANPIAPAQLEIINNRMRN